MDSTDPRAQIVSLLPRLRRFARGLTPDRHLADDLVQSACLKALERWHQWQPGTSLASWLFRIVQNTWIDEFRARARQPVDDDEDALLDLPGDDGRAIVERRSELRAVRRAIADLPEDQQPLVRVGPKRVDLKAIVDEACTKAAAAGYRDVNKILVFEKSALPR